jgi:hypothetical protein
MQVDEIISLETSDSIDFSKEYKIVTERYVIA